MGLSADYKTWMSFLNVYPTFAGLKQNRNAILAMGPLVPFLRDCGIAKVDIDAVIRKYGDVSGGEMNPQWKLRHELGTLLVLLR